MEATCRIRFNEAALDGEFSAVSGEVHDGEIVGVAGLDGHGQAAFIKSLCGLQTPTSGTIQIRGSDNIWSANASFRETITRGGAFVPRDRKEDGIFSGISVLDNFAIASLRRFSRGGRIDTPAMCSAFEAHAERLDIVTSSPRDDISSLSGGNQQKVLIARWLASDPAFVVLDDPTRGIDVATKLRVYQLFEELVADGRAVVILSTDLAELTKIAHRVLVFRLGEIVAEVIRPDISPDTLIAAMFGGVTR